MIAVQRQMQSKEILVVEKKSGAVRDLIKAERAARGMSQTQFAAHIGTTPAVLQRWESATTSPSGLLTARLIACGFDVYALIEAFMRDAQAKTPKENL